MKFCDTIREPQQGHLWVEESPSNLKKPYTDNGRGQDSEIFAKLAGHKFRSVSTQHSEGWVQDRVRLFSTLLGSQRNPSKQSGFSGSFIRGSPNTPQKRDNRTNSTRRGIRWFLFNVLHRSQEGRREKTNIKPKTTECIHNSQIILHGNFT